MLKKKRKQKQVLILHTGGTIGMGLPLPPRSPTALKPDHQFIKRLRTEVPELWQIAGIHVRPVANKDSSQLTPNDWAQLFKMIQSNEDQYDGFVVTHGTDTMVYSATALSYLLPFPCKPVVFTGSQRPLGELRTDARRNLINAVGLAADQWICEVSLFFDTFCLRANRAKKVHIEEFHAFDSPNFMHLAQDKLRPWVATPAREVSARPSLNPTFSTDIQILRAFPGVQLQFNWKSDAILLEAYGCGNLPLRGLEKQLTTAADKKIPVILTSQVPAGRLSPEIYEAGHRALELGAISSGDMTFEAALVKAMLLAGNNVPYSEWKRLIQTNWAGELTPG